MGGAGMAEHRQRLVRLAVLEELRASYGIKVKSGSCLAVAKAPGAAAEVSGAGGAQRAPLPGPGRTRGALTGPVAAGSAGPGSSAVPVIQPLPPAPDRASPPVMGLFPVSFSVPALRGAVLYPCCDSGR